MEKKKDYFPPLKEQYVLRQQDQAAVDLMKEEIEYRLHTTVSIDVYQQSLLTHPHPTSGTSIFIELRAGEWKRIFQTSIYDLEQNSASFFYFLRKIVDDTMEDMLQRGARAYGL